MLKSKGAKFLKSDITFLFITFTPVAAIFFLIPFELYYNARQYWNFNRSIPVSFAIAGLAAYIALLAIVFIALRVRRQLGIYISIFLFCLGTFVLLADVFSPLQASPLDGTEITSTEPLKISLIEAFILVAVLSMALFLRPPRLILLAVAFTLFLVLLSAGYLGLIILTPESGPRLAWKQRKNPNLRGNVYHVVLDEMQTDAAMLFFEDEEARSNFPGFTLFRYNMCNYLYTRASLPSYMTGNLYREGSFKRWRNRFKKEGLIKDLYDKGYRITMYSPRANWKNPYVAHFKSLQKIYEEETQEKSAYYNDFTQIWLARIMPNVLTNEALLWSKGLGQWVYARFKIRKSDDRFPRIKGMKRAWLPVKISEGVEPFSSLLMLNRMIEEEKARTSNGEYVYGHAVLPHGPFIFDENCEYQPGLRKKGVFGYFSQVKCAFRLIIDFLEELKRLRRYDSSTIVIHADTGHGHLGYIKREGSNIIGIKGDKARLGERFLGNPLVWNKHQVLARTMALLMIKPAHASEDLKYSEKLSQLIDLRFTLADLLDLRSKAKTRGIPLYLEEVPKTRESVFFFYPPEDEEPEMIRITISNPRRLWESTLVVQGFKGKRSEAGADESVIFR